MKVGEKLEIEGWPTKIHLQKEKALLGEVKKVWRKERHQFFILKHCDSRFTFMGAICFEKYELFSLIANKIKGDINSNFITIFPCNKLNSVIVTIKEKKYIAFLSGISNRENDILSTIKGNKTVKGILEEAIRRFDEKKERIREEIPLCFSEE